MPKPSGIIKPRIIPSPKPTVTQVPIPKAAPKPIVNSPGSPMDGAPRLYKQPPPPKENSNFVPHPKPRPGDNVTPPKNVLSGTASNLTFTEQGKDFTFKEIPLEDGSVYKPPKKKRTY